MPSTSDREIESHQHFPILASVNSLNVGHLLRKANVSIVPATKSVLPLCSLMDSDHEMIMMLCAMPPTHKHVRTSRFTAEAESLKLTECDAGGAFTRKAASEAQCSTSLPLANLGLASTRRICWKRERHFQTVRMARRSVVEKLGLIAIGRRFGGEMRWTELRMR